MTIGVWEGLTAAYVQALHMDNEKCMRKIFCEEALDDCCYSMGAL